jgi:hypothetical protein
MDCQTMDALFVRGHLVDRNKNKSSGAYVNLEVDLNLLDNL